MATTILVLNGPNLNLLGRREPKIYGSMQLADIETLCKQRANSWNIIMEFRQSNHEGQLISWIHDAYNGDIDGIIINPGAYTHTSIALYDALVALQIPIIEVHLTNIFAREAFRHHSYISFAASGIICGLGAAGYELALEAIARQLITDSPSI